MVNRSIALEPKANAYTLLGKILSEQGKYEESESALLKALVLDSSNTPALALRGVVRAALGRKQEAYADFEETLRRDPLNAIARQGMKELMQHR